MSSYIIRAPNHLGDCIMAMASFQTLPETIEYSLLAPDWAEPLYCDLKRAKFCPIPAGSLHGLEAISNQREMIKDIKADAGLLLTPSFSSALIFNLGGVKRRYGFATDCRGMLLTDPVNIKSVPVHRADRYRFLMEGFFDLKLQKDMPRISISPQSESNANNLLDQYGLQAQARFVAIAAQAVAESRRWGSGNYASLAGKLTAESGLKVVILGTEGESAAGEEIKNGREEIVNLCGTTDIETAAGVLSKAVLFIGNDSGLAHLAGAVGVPLVVLSGADNPAETSPLASNKTVIIRSELECISCVKNKCLLAGERHMQCMKQITVDDVMLAAGEYLA